MDAHHQEYKGVYGRDFVRFRLNIVSGQVLDGPEHGATPLGTLCELDVCDVFLMRHHFNPNGRNACAKCAAVARSALGT